MGVRMDHQGGQAGDAHKGPVLSRCGALAIIRQLCERKRPEWFDVGRYPALTANEREVVFKRAHRQSLNEKRRPKRKRGENQ